MVTEPVVPAGWTLTSISPTPAVIGGTPVTVTVTNTRNGIPGLDKTSAPADGVAQVAPGDLINYTVTVSNVGGLPITGPVVDTLPAGLTVVADDDHRRWDAKRDEYVSPGRWSTWHRERR